MKTKLYILGAVTLVLALVVGGVSYASAASPTNDSVGFGEGIINGIGQMIHRGGPGRGDVGGQRPEGDSELHPYIEAAIADILGITTDELAESKDAGVRLEDLVEAQGLTMEEFDAAMDAAKADIIAQALTDGAITQEQADWMLANDLGGPAGGPRGGNRGLNGAGEGTLHEYIDAVVADFLGMTPEELAASHEAGVTMQDLLAEKDLTQEDLQAALEAAKEDIVAQALADGAITETQAEQILANEGFGPAFGSKGPGMFGGEFPGDHDLGEGLDGMHAPRGNRGPGGRSFSPRDNQVPPVEAPSNDS